jgi:hypothetical protein
LHNTVVAPLLSADVLENSLIYFCVLDRCPQHVDQIFYNINIFYFSSSLQVAVASSIKGVFLTAQPVSDTAFQFSISLKFVSSIGSNKSKS